MGKHSKAAKSAERPITNLKPEKINEIVKKVKKDIFKTILLWCTIITILFGSGLLWIYLNTIGQLKTILVNRISEEFKQPAIRKTIEDVAANNAKQVFVNEIQPEVIRFKTDIRSEIDIFKKDVDEKINKIASNKQSELAQQFPSGYAVLGFPLEHGVIFRKEYVPDGVDVDWGATKIEKITNDTIVITFPNIAFQGSIFKNVSMDIAKKVGSKARLIQSSNWLLCAEIISIERNLIVIAVGFEKTK